ncbi:CHAT domain-containing protein [Alteraurantiacibacter aestuarii]|uniref:CHAT domain-containing protein n=1 Tax=Alteraurantiacibacter aestuarii TaxID=650004 RepID=A0A844ZLK4_9SPHN|nr:CHAT domain-containing tetratricopeptide repeat protein [Alteraurantiacibacter aestuarii]MXO88182.1 CHAT domain-containing protein [Alteraurantiacibacter aestuarii]
MKIERFSMRKLALPLASAMGLAIATCPAAAQQGGSVGLRDSVPIGSNGLCEAQIQSPRAGEGLFDRRYLIICRDAAAPVGMLQVLGSSDMDAAYARVTSADAQCRDGDIGERPLGLSGTRGYLCSAPDTGIERMVIVGSAGNRTYAASGLAVYDDALRIGLSTLATDRLVDGTVDVPLTQAGGSQAFARAQAEAISAEIALNEAYRRSNAGNFAEAAEFFTASASALQGNSATEALLNAALQQSNLGNFREAGTLFLQAAPQAANDPILARLARNFQAVDALNRGRAVEVIQILDTPLPELTESLDATLQLQIDNALSERLSAEQGNAIAGVASNLSLLERAQLLDGQSRYLRASALRQMGQIDAAQAALLSAQSDIVAVRDGRVVSILWLRAQILAELAEIEERRGNLAGAEDLHLQAVNVLESNYPGSPALLSARAQLAGLLARTGREDEAISVYRQLVSNADSKPASSLRSQLAPYFEILGKRAGNEQAAADMFAASQLLLRPGLAQTQAVLARELSAGSDEASQLFRQALNLNRAIEVMRGNVAQAALVPEATPGAAADLAAKREQLDQLRQLQLGVQQQLAAYPRYRVVSDDRMELGDLQDVLHDGEAYLKLVMLGDDVYAIYAQKGVATAYPVAASADDIGVMVDRLRDSIAIEEAGQTITYPFEIATARDLYKAIFGPVDANLANVTELVFEPDGAMLRLPANLLVMDDASVATYAARVEDPAADPYDFRGTAWLGRAMQITTAVSPSSFRDVRGARASDATGEYLGLGQNLPLAEGLTQASGTRSGIAGERCTWSPLTWGNPIQATELRTAGSILQEGGSGVSILTEGEFTDTHLRAMTDLDEYRIIHFATHGLVTSPEADCPPRPALLTSFGDGDSDGLLSFAEIFDLRLDADLVILSACNTASVGGLTASREAGVATGGDFALDGLVRAFVGAGGRTVVASHWPVPDDYGATGRLISGFFHANSGVSTTEALRQSQLSLMDDADTSHPFYWSAFAVVGDGSIPVRR